MSSDKAEPLSITRYSPLSPPPHRCDAVEAGGMVYVSGISAYDGDMSAVIREQTIHTLEKLDKVLTAAGTSKLRLVWANVWLADTADFEGFNEVWKGWINSADAPARACVGAKLMIPGLRVEIAVVAAK